MNQKLKPCPFCGSDKLSVMDVSYSPVFDGKAVECGWCGLITVLGRRELGDARAASLWNARADLPTPSLPPRLSLSAAPPDRLASVLFCPVCFASEDSGSWNHVVTNSGLCTNCGNGSTVTMPRWAVDEIRRQASFVGSRYYPNAEDHEQQRELQTLRAVPSEYPGRSVERGVDDDHGVFFAVKQVMPGDRYSVITFYARDCGSAEHALELARTRMPYFTREQLAGAKI